MRPVEASVFYLNEIKPLMKAEAAPRPAEKTPIITVTTVMETVGGVNKIRMFSHLQSVTELDMSAGRKVAGLNPCCCDLWLIPAAAAAAAAAVPWSKTVSRAAAAAAD